MNMKSQITNTKLQINHNAQSRKLSGQLSKLFWPFDIWELFVACFFALHLWKSLN